MNLYVRNQSEQNLWQFDGPPESTAPLRSAHQTGASSGPHLDLIRPPASRGGGVKQPHTEHAGPLQRKLRKQRCDTWVSQHHLRFHCFIFSLSSSRWAQTHLKVKHTSLWNRSLVEKKDLEYKLQRANYEMGLICIQCWSSSCLMNLDSKNWFRPAPIIWNQYVSILTNSTASLN